LFFDVSGKPEVMSTWLPISPLTGLAAVFILADGATGVPRVPVRSEKAGTPPGLGCQILAQPGDPAPVDVAGVNRVTRAVAGYRVGDELRRHAIVDQRVIELKDCVMGTRKSPVSERIKVGAFIFDA
jgi:hypothetical protein